MSSQATHIRVTLSRPLTWAEREGLADTLVDYELLEVITGHSVVKEDKEPKVLNVYSMSLTSRQLFDLVHTILGQDFVNVYIKSVRTIYPKVKV